ncbi:mechanosensitive ion channel family protein [Acinetobacter rudis]|uniref:Mechanosensitive ion channel n=1 Tax=Acinetobacter rudis TaxID=632955 RepID=A0AAW8J7K5_9GAMM|nr:mechanosensitive ion channel domain-containing protein [Acinetobacter rudis]MDQ8935735.1 mechanosensitive ion channel [Acinetobacter rudis]MDQ8952123.1 mechanosensitive ion channel [Acinetobacter rudis]MDQ9018064.1 mechanosensitive ion channel [Acinetobacter rudis]
MLQPTYIQKLEDWIDNYPWLEMLTSLGILIAIAIVITFIAKYIVVRGIFFILGKFKATHYNQYIKNSIVQRIANIAPALVILNGIVTVPHLSIKAITFIQMLAQAFIVLTITLALSGLLNTFNMMYKDNPRSRDKPIKGYLQLIKLIMFIVCGLLILGTFLQKDILNVLAGFGAMAAVLMLVFQNTILSLVASVQIASYEIVRLGDWIEMPSLNADGTVVDISLHTVTVENFDKTFTTIPTNKLITDTFKNWRGMSNAGVRRFKRSIFIDQNSIHFLDDAAIKRLSGFEILQDYLREKQNELAHYNHEIEHLAHQNQRQLTNIGTFRAYVEYYLKRHPQVSQKDSLIVRQMQPTSTGLPLEIYGFTTTTAWSEYEAIQSDIFDHLIAIIPLFDLNIYQAPSGLDIKTWANANTQQ